jgi:hypothetical protein
MNPGNLAVRPTAEDASMLFAIWPRCTEAPQVVRNEIATTQ